MNNRIIYKRPDGGVSVIIPCIEAINFNETEEAFLLRIASKDVPQGCEWRIVDVSEIPSDRTFRGAWEDSDGIKVNMTKARQIHMNRLRDKRKPKLEALDKEQLRGLEDNDAVKLDEIKAKKKSLRDITQTFDLTRFATPEALKEAIPDELK